MTATRSDPTEALTDAQRRALETLVVSHADDEFVIAERYTEWQVRAPTLESDLALANIAQDELGHARLCYDLLEDLGYDEPDLLYERDPADFRHATLCALPFEEGDWADAIVRSYLYDVAESIRLEALAESSYPRLADRVPKMLEEESYHRQHAETWLERLAESPDGRGRLQGAVTRLYPHALALFHPTTPPRLGRHDDGPSAGEIEAVIVDSGLRPVTLKEMATEWLEVTSATLEGLDLDLPLDDAAITADALVEPLGRDGDHIDAWSDLHEAFTHTYHDLGRTDTTRIMPDPDDE